MTLTGCAQLGIGETGQPGPTATASAPSAVPNTADTTPATEAERPTPVNTPDEQPEVRQIAAYYIKVDDGGQFGYEIECGDSVVPVYHHAEVSAVPVRESVEALLSFEGEYYQDSGFYNALHRSDLRAVSAHVDTDNDIVHVYLVGQLRLDDRCDLPRAEQQIAFTAAHAAGTNWAKVYLNDQPFDEAATSL